MVMSLRQQRLYTDRADIYAPALAPDALGRTEQSYGPSATYTNVKCHITPRPESTIPNIAGGVNQDNLDTTDIIHVLADQELGTGYMIQLKTPGHPERLTWYEVQGEARVQNWRAKFRACYLKRSLRPPGVA